MGCAISSSSTDATNHLPSKGLETRAPKTEEARRAEVEKRMERMLYAKKDLLSKKALPLMESDGAGILSQESLNKVVTEESRFRRKAAKLAAEAEDKWMIFSDLDFDSSEDAELLTHFMKAITTYLPYIEVDIDARIDALNAALLAFGATHGHHSVDDTVSDNYSFLKGGAFRSEEEILREGTIALSRGDSSISIGRYDSSHTITVGRNDSDTNVSVESGGSGSSIINISRKNSSSSSFSRLSKSATKRISNHHVVYASAANQTQRLSNAGEYVVQSGPVSASTVEEVINLYRRNGRLSSHSVHKLLRIGYRHLKALPNTNRLTIAARQRVVVVGDIHGQLSDLLYILDTAGLPSPTNKYVFNGDFVDRGGRGVEVMCVLLTLLAAFPDHVILNRGNHEDFAICCAYGFQLECTRKYNDITFGMFVELFHHIPLFAIINEAVFVVHGGLFHCTDATLQELNAITRADYSLKEIPEGGETLEHVPRSREQEFGQQLVRDALWSDPRSSDGLHHNLRGAGVGFGPDIARSFLKTNNLEMVVRSHECVRSGFDRPYSGDDESLCCTVFSASNYGDGGNSAAYMVFSLQPLPDDGGAPPVRVESSNLMYTVFYFDIGVEGFDAIQDDDEVTIVQSGDHSADYGSKFSLREIIIANRRVLRAEFDRIDEKWLGVVTKLQWADVMLKVLKLNLGWLSLIPVIVPDDCFSSSATDQKGDPMIKYKPFLRSFSRTTETSSVRTEETSDNESDAEANEDSPKSDRSDTSAAISELSLENHDEDLTLTLKIPPLNTRHDLIDPASSHLSPPKSDILVPHMDRGSNRLSPSHGTIPPSSDSFHIITHPATTTTADMASPLRSVTLNLSEKCRLDHLSPLSPPVHRDLGSETLDDKDKNMATNAKESAGVVSAGEGEGAQSDDVDDVVKALYPRHKLLEQAFKFFDINDTGAISSLKLSLGCDYINDHIKPPMQRLSEYDTLMRIMDVCDRGQIDVNEFFEMFRLCDVYSKFQISKAIELREQRDSVEALQALNTVMAASASPSSSAAPKSAVNASSKLRLTDISISVDPSTENNEEECSLSARGKSSSLVAAAFPEKASPSSTPRLTTPRVPSISSYLADLNKRGSIAFEQPGVQNQGSGPALVAEAEAIARQRSGSVRATLSSQFSHQNLVLTSSKGRLSPVAAVDLNASEHSKQRASLDVNQSLKPNNPVNLNASQHGEIFSASSSFSVSGSIAEGKNEDLANSDEHSDSDSDGSDYSMYDITENPREAVSLRLSPVPTLGLKSLSTFSSSAPTAPPATTASGAIVAPVPRLPGQIDRVSKSTSPSHNIPGSSAKSGAFTRILTPSPHLSPPGSGRLFTVSKTTELVPAAAYTANANATQSGKEQRTSSLKFDEVVTKASSFKMESVTSSSDVAHSASQFEQYQHQRRIMRTSSGKDVMIDVPSPRVSGKGSQYIFQTTQGGSLVLADVVATPRAGDAPPSLSTSSTISYHSSSMDKVRMKSGESRDNLIYSGSPRSGSRQPTSSLPLLSSWDADDNVLAIKGVQIRADVKPTTAATLTGKESSLNLTDSSVTTTPSTFDI